MRVASEYPHVGKLTFVGKPRKRDFVRTKVQLARKKGRTVVQRYNNMLEIYL